MANSGRKHTWKLKRIWINIIKTMRIVLCSANALKVSPVNTTNSFYGQLLILMTSQLTHHLGNKKTIIKNTHTHTHK